MLLAFVMDVIVYLKSHRIDIAGDSGNEPKEIPLEDKTEDFLKTSTILFQDIDDDQNTKVAV